MAHDLVGHVLVAAGFRTRALSPDERRAGGPAPVVVLVDPAPDDWADAAAAGRVVLMASEPLDAAGVADAVLRGADAVLHLTASSDEVAITVNAVAAGDTLLDPSTLRTVIDRVRTERAVPSAPAVRLTTREVDILRAIDDGASVKQTARRLGIAEKTVENLQSRLYRKLGVRNRAQALWEAHSLGLFASASASVSN